MQDEYIFGFFDNLPKSLKAYKTGEELFDDWKAYDRSQHCITSDDWLEFAINRPHLAWIYIPKQFKTQEIELICKMG